jgi:energy-coupling factor transporter transmembrane protein EcfT
MMYVYIYIHNTRICIHIYILIYIYIYINMQTHPLIYIHVFIYTYIYICIHSYIYMSSYLHMWRLSLWVCWIGALPSLCTCQSSSGPYLMMVRFTWIDYNNKERAPLLSPPPYALAKAWPRHSQGRAKA